MRTSIHGASRRACMHGAERGGSVWPAAGAGGAARERMGGRPTMPGASAGPSNRKGADMTYLIAKLAVYLAIAFIIGLVVGWWTSEPRRRA